MQRQFYLVVCFNEKFFYILRLRSADLRNELPFYLFEYIDILILLSNEYVICEDYFSVKQREKSIKMK